MSHCTVDAHSLCSDELLDCTLNSEDDSIETESVCDFELFAFEKDLLFGTKRGSIPVKSSKCIQNGSKLRRKAFRRVGQLDNNAAVNSVQCRSIVTRRTTDEKKLTLYAFPSFDRSDALLFVPSTLATYFNTTDMYSVSKVFQSRLDKDCKVRISCLTDELLDVKALLQFHTFLCQLHPDNIFCVHSTKVVENQIRATVYSKFTYCKAIYDFLGKGKIDPLFTVLCGEPRFARALSPSKRPDLMAVVTSHPDANLQVYMQIDMCLTVDDLTKKITRYELECNITSVLPPLL